MNSPKSPELIAALQRTISRERLEKYLIASDGDESKAIELYEKNCRLSESFYTPLQCFEVCLRNTLHSQLSSYYGVSWFRNGGPPLDSAATEDINLAINDLGGTAAAPSPGAVVAELKLGFWVSILGKRYDATLWRTCLHKAFKRKLARQAVHGRLNALRRFRNRVAHHEPIFHVNVQQMHDEIIDTISWMCADTSAWAASMSRFKAVNGD